MLSQADGRNARGSPANDKLVELSCSCALNALITHGISWANPVVGRLSRFSRYSAVLGQRIEIPAVTKVRATPDWVATSTSK